MAKTNWQSGDYVDHTALNTLGQQVNNAEESEEIDQLRNDSQARIIWGSTATAIATPAKVVTLERSSYVPKPGDLFTIEFTNGNSIGNATLSLNGSPALPLISAGTTTNSQSLSISPGAEVMVRHDTSGYRMLTGTTIVYGIVTAAELQAGTSTGGRIISPQIVAQNMLTLAAGAPANATATGRVGQYWLASDYLYICTANNVWRRTPLSTW